MNILILTIALALGAYFGLQRVEEPERSVVKQVHAVEANPVATPEPTPIPDQQIDIWVDEYAEKFATNKAHKNALKVKLHFLLFKEAGYGSNKTCGDHGKACGPLQFHEPTYKGFRREMLEEGVVTEVGSRLDMENAIETTAWAIADGRELNWGPILRREIKL